MCSRYNEHCIYIYRVNMLHKVYIYIYIKKQTKKKTGNAAIKKKKKRIQKTLRPGDQLEHYKHTLNYCINLAFRTENLQRVRSWGGKKNF